MAARVNRKSNRSVTKPRNPEGTRARILDKAEVLFAKSGFEGTSLAELVKAAGVNKRMVYHYFGDKEGLYQSLFAHHWLGLKNAIVNAPPGELSDLLGQVFEYLAARPRFVRLLMWDGLEGGKISRSLWKEVRGPLFAQTATHIGAAQKSGRLDPAFDPAQLVVSFLGAITFYFGYANSLGDLLGVEDPLAASELGRYGSHLRRLADAVTKEKKL